MYWVRGHIELDGQRLTMSPTVIGHGSVLLGVFFAVKAWSYGLDRYLLLYGDNGVVVGASYTDTHVELPVLWVLIGLAVIAAAMSWANLQARTFRLPVTAAVLVFGSALALAEVFPALFERLFVRPGANWSWRGLTFSGASRSPGRPITFIKWQPGPSRSS